MAGGASDNNNASSSPSRRTLKKAPNPMEVVDENEEIEGLKKVEWGDTPTGTKT